MPTPQRLTLHAPKGTYCLREGQTNKRQPQTPQKRTSAFSANLNLDNNFTANGTRYGPSNA